MTIKGFKLREFVSSCSTCMGKEDLLSTDANVQPDQSDPTADTGNTKPGT